MIGNGAFVGDAGGGYVDGRRVEVVEGKSVQQLQVVG